jgi:methyltransferase
MTMIAIAVGVVFGLMLAEQRVSATHEVALRREGAVEPPGDVYRAMAVLYPAAFLLMATEGFWRASVDAGPAGFRPAWPVSGALLFAASKGLKYWAIASLGPRWSFKVLVLPGRPLVTSGPYAYVRHPNYIAVMGELAGTAMMVGARLSGPIMMAAFGLVLWARIRVEDRALGRLPAGSQAAASEGKGL